MEIVLLKLIKLYLFKLRINGIIKFCFFLGFSISLDAQYCGILGKDGPTNQESIINTYYPPVGNTIVSAGDTTIILGSVPTIDKYGNSFGSIPISIGDLLLIIQIQDGLISNNNSNLYGSGKSKSGPDELGGTGFISLGNAGQYEYVTSLNEVPLSGGILKLRGLGNKGGLINDYINNFGDGKEIGKKTFQVVRISQFSALTLSKNISAPPFNGNVGGIIVFNVFGDLNFNKFSIDATGRGFRGGYQRVQESGCNTTNIYGTNTDILASGKGEGIAGSPRYMWDGFNEVDNGEFWLGFPGASFGKGAPANAGGGGNDHNAGGGGGGNGGFGGVGGIGWQGAGICIGNSDNLSGGRPGSSFNILKPNRLFLGGGGGGGDANNALTGTKGGVGGGIIIVNAGRLVGFGKILSNGSAGDRGVFANAPDGAGGGGAGGTILLNIKDISSSADLKLIANGGIGGNTENDLNNEHGPGGGGGGGIIWYSTNDTKNIFFDVSAGQNGLTNNGNNGAISFGSTSGTKGYFNSYKSDSISSFTLIDNANCLPELKVFKQEINSGKMGIRAPGTNATYIITIENSMSGGGAAGVQINDKLPVGFKYLNSTVTYLNGASGPFIPYNFGDSVDLKIGEFIIPSNGKVILYLNILIEKSVIPGVYHNGAQVLYLDPSRTINNPNRLISPLNNSISGQNTTYESGGETGKPVSGQNYDGTVNGPNSEDVHINYPIKIISTNNLCVGGNLQLDVNIPDSILPSSFEWNGPGIFLPSSIVKNPKILNVDEQNSGFYQVILTDKTGNIYVDSVEIKVGLNYSIDSTAIEICSGESFSFNPTNDSSGKLLPQNIRYSWVVSQNENISGQISETKGQSLISDTLTNLTEIPQKIIYDITTYPFSCKMTSFKITVIVNPNPAGNILEPDYKFICKGSTRRISATTGGDYYKWYKNDSLISETKNPYYDAVSSGSYKVQIISQKKCQLTANKSIELTLFEKPLIDFLSEDFYCIGSSITFNNISRTADEDTILWRWDFGDGKFSNTFNASHTYQNSDIYFVKLEGESKKCPQFNNNFTKKIIVNVPIPGIRYPNKNIVINTPFQIKAREIGINYTWFPKVGLDNYNVYNPVFKYGQDIEYFIKIEEESGCITTDTIAISLHKLEDFVVPNSFTPNNDGNNDKLEFFPIGISKFIVFRVFNRWGQLLFESFDETDFWDGTYNGVLQPLDSYVWMAEGFVDNEYLVSKRGQFILIR